MRALFLGSTLMLGLLAMGWAQEFEVVSSTSLAAAQTSDTTFSVSQRLAGSLNLALGQPGQTLSMAAHVSGSVPAAFEGDLDLLSWATVFRAPSALLDSADLTVGRLRLADSTGYLLNHTADGFMTHFRQGAGDLSVFLGYTGLLLNASSPLALSLADLEVTSRLTASPRWIGGATASLQWGQGQTVLLSALAQQDAHASSDLVPEWQPTYNPSRGGRLDTQYLTLQGNGPLAKGIFYDAFVTFGSGSTLSWVKQEESPTGYEYEYRPIVSFLGGLRADAALPWLLSSNGTLRVLVASGDPDAESLVEGNTKDWSTSFVPITSAPLAVVFQPALSNLVQYELTVNFGPWDALPLTAQASAFGFQRAVAGVTGGGALRQGPLWLGQEADVRVAWTPYSDLSISASVGAFVPTAGTFATGSRGAGFQSAARLGVTLSL